MPSRISYFESRTGNILIGAEYLWSFYTFSRIFRTNGLFKDSFLSLGQGMYTVIPLDVRLLSLVRIKLFLNCLNTNMDLNQIYSYVIERVPWRGSRSFIVDSIIFNLHEMNIKILQIFSKFWKYITKLHCALSFSKHLHLNPF